MLCARHISEWTGLPLADHLDQDVVRWNIARAEALACVRRLAGGGAGVEPAPATGPQNRRGVTRMVASSSVPGSFTALAAMTKESGS